MNKSCRINAKSAGVIGIIGGVGAYAGLDLNRKIFEFSHARTDQAYPEVYLLTVPSVPDRSRYLLYHDVVHPGKVLIEVVDKLCTIGVDVFAVPCNTAHSPEIIDMVATYCQDKEHHIRFVHMIKETAAVITNTIVGIQRVGLLATLGTYFSRVYSQVLAKKSVSVLYPESKQDREDVHSSIYDPEYGIKSISDPIHQKAIDILQKQGNNLLRQGAEAIILGCTEISLAHSFLTFSVPVFDPLEILAQALLRAVAYTADKR